MSMTETRNDVEELLLKAQAGELDSKAFMDGLMASQLIMPIHHDNDSVDPQNADSVKPLTVKNEDGSQRLILFTSPERATAFVKNHPGYGSGLLADFKWIVDEVGTDLSISINPGHELGFDLEAGSLKQTSQP